MEVAVYTGKALKQLPEEQRSKKEMQLAVNLKKAMEALGDSLLDARMTRATLWERRLPVQEEMMAQVRPVSYSAVGTAAVRPSCRE